MASAHLRNVYSQIESLSPTATAPRRLASAILAAAMLAYGSDTGAHSILPPADAIPPIGFADAYGPAAARAADEVRPGETPAAAQTRLEADGECPYYVARVLGLATLKGTFGGSFGEWAPSAIVPLWTAAGLGDVPAGRVACHLANEVKRYLLRDRPDACLNDGGRTLEDGNRTLQRSIKAYTRCRQRGHAAQPCVKRAVANIGGDTRARLARLRTRLGDVEAGAGRWDDARRVWQAAEEAEELGAYERARFGVPPDAPEPAGPPINQTIRTIMVAAAGGYEGGLGRDKARTMPWRPWDATREAAERDARTGDIVRMAHYATIRIGEHQIEHQGYWRPALRCTGELTGGVAVPADVRATGWKRPYCELALDDPDMAAHFSEERWGAHGIETAAWLLLIAERTSRLRDLLGWSMRDHAWAHRHAEALLAPLWRTYSPAWRREVLERAHALDAEVPYRSWRRTLLDPQTPMTIQRPGPDAG